MAGRRIFALFLGLGLAACGRKGDSSQTPPAVVSPDSELPLGRACPAEDSPLRELSVDHNPLTDALKVTAVLGGDRPVDVVYAVGSLQDAQLLQPIATEPPVDVQCLDEACLRLRLVVPGRHLQVAIPVEVQRVPVVSLSETYDASYSNEPEMVYGPEGQEWGRHRSAEQTWRYSIAQGHEVSRSSVWFGCVGGRSHYSVRIGFVNESDGEVGHHVLSGTLGGQQADLYFASSKGDTLVQSSISRESIASRVNDGGILLLDYGHGRVALALSAKNEP